jgi:hypothetical protein
VVDLSGLDSRLGSVEDAPYAPCDCPICDPDPEDSEDIPDDEPDYPRILLYEVFFQ